MRLQSSTVSRRSCDGDALRPQRGKSAVNFGRGTCCDSRGESAAAPRARENGCDASMEFSAALLQCAIGSEESAVWRAAGF